MSEQISALADLAKIRETLMQLQNVLPRGATREEKDDLRNALVQVEKSFKDGIIEWSKSKIPEKLKGEKVPVKSEPKAPGRPKKIPDAVKEAMQDTVVKQVEVR
jgi:hypothetical protein